MQRLNAAPFPLQLVVDASGRLLGAMTDGDVRRSLLRLDGGAEQQPVSAAMQSNVLTGSVGEDARNLQRVRQTKSVIPFLPVVDKDGVLAEVLIGVPTRESLETALIMAGGFGRRLGATTSVTPKPLLSVGGRPILDHILERLEDSGVKQVFIAVHYLAEQFAEFIQQRKGRSEVRLIVEREPLGTAGALGMLPASIGVPVMVLNGDIVTSIDFGAMAQFHDRGSFDGTIAVAQHEVEIQFGVVRHSEDGIFEGIDEKPRVRHFVAAGIYLINPEVRTLVRPGQSLDMPQLLNLARSIGLRVGLFPVHEPWMDIGRPQDLEAARRQHDGMTAK
jgi:dTDP-glucose pyrophosphorylase